MPEEVVLLVENGMFHVFLVDLLNVTRPISSELAVMIDDPHAHPDPSASTLQKYNDERSEAAAIQISLAEAKEAKEAGRAMSEEAIRKRKEREQKKALQKVKATSSESPESLFDPDPSTSVPAQTANNPTTATSTAAYTVVVPSSSSSLPWYAPQSSTYTTLARARTAGVWTYPSTLHERARCGVFRGLWEQGYFMGGGIKFGGDYLVYPGEYI